MEISKCICVSGEKVNRIKILNELGFTGFEWCLTITPEEIEEEERKSPWIGYKHMPVFIHADFRTMKLYREMGCRRSSYANTEEMVNEICDVLKNKNYKK